MMYWGSGLATSVHVYTCTHHACYMYSDIVYYYFSFSSAKTNTTAATDSFDIRWFSPTCEVNICGHGTLAAAVVLSEVYDNPNKTIYYNSLSGKLKTVIDNKTVQLSLPLRPCEPIDNPETIFRDLVRLTVGDTPVLHYQYSTKALDLLIRLDDSVSRSDLEGLKPDTGAMLGINQNKVISIAVTVKANQLTEEGRGYDFFSRYFCPWCGNPEDYVTGKFDSNLARNKGRVQAESY